MTLSIDSVLGAVGPGLTLAYDFAASRALALSCRPGLAVPGAHRGRLNLDEEIRHLVAPKFLRFETSGITLTVPSQEEVVVKIWR